MDKFTATYLAIDRSNRISEKVAALVDYFRIAPPEDAIWAVYLFAGRKIGRTVTSTQLRNWIAELTGYPTWLIEESYHVVGDLSETISLLVPYGRSDDLAIPLHELIESILKPLGTMPQELQKKSMIELWKKLSPQETFILHKLISTNFRVGVSKQSLINALAEVAGVPAAVIAHRLSGNWKPTAQSMQRILSSQTDQTETDANVPYPFMLAHPLTEKPVTLGAIDEWQLEWKWDGIRAQLIRRNGKSAIWSRGDENISDAFPEIIQAMSTLPDGTVLDGELVAWDEQVQKPYPFSVLQKRLNRKSVDMSFWPDVPVAVIGFDLLEYQGIDLREKPLHERRSVLESIAGQFDRAIFRNSEKIIVTNWEALEPLIAESRERSVEGVMIKQKTSVYKAGRVTGPWWKLKVSPYTVDAVLIAAQPGTGRRAGLLTDYTFGVWNDEQTELLPVAKAYSGLTDKEVEEMDRYVRNHTTGRFGPVHAVKPERVVELGFEAIARSTRHKSGIAVRFPRILRLRDDKKPIHADNISYLRKLLNQSERVT